MSNSRPFSRQLGRALHTDTAKAGCFTASAAFGISASNTTRAGDDECAYRAEFERRRIDLVGHSSMVPVGSALIPARAGIPAK